MLSLEAAHTDDSEVLVETVPDEDATEVDQQSQFLVSDLERNERVPRVLRVEIAGCAIREQIGSGHKAIACRGGVAELTSDTGELGQVVDDGLAGVDMIIDGRDASLFTFTAQDRHSCKDLSRGSEHLLGTVRVELGFLLLKRDKLGVDGDECAFSRQLVRSERLVLDERAVTSSANCGCASVTPVVLGGRTTAAYREMLMSSQRTLGSAFMGKSSRSSTLSTSTRSKKSTAGICGGSRVSSRFFFLDRTREIEHTFHLPGKLKTSSSVTGLTRKSLKRCQDAPVLPSSDVTAGRFHEFRQKMQRSTEACLTLCQRNQMRRLVLRLDLHDHRLHGQCVSA